MNRALKSAAASLEPRCGTFHDAFAGRGYVGPLSLFDRQTCRRILRQVRRRLGTPPADWSKGHAVSSRSFFEVATCRPLLDRVAELLGEDFVLWGASLVCRQPGAVHPWHTDLESATSLGRTATAWIGLENTTLGSSPNVVSGSHRFDVSVQEMTARFGRSRDSVSDEDVVAWAREFDDSAELVRFDARDGDAIIFDGRLWHGTRNTNRRGARTALLLQYATPDVPIRVPDLSVPDWPFRYHAAPRPGCIVVRGRDGTMTNRTVPGPAPEKGVGPAVTSWIKGLDLPLAEDTETGWKPHNVFRGPTRYMTDLSCHVSVLSPGVTPHPPHSHASEELLVMLSGEADLEIVNKGKDPSTETHRLRPGAFVYYPAGQFHTITNPTGEPATYLMFKWLAGEAGNDREMETSVFEVDEEAAPPPGNKGFAPRCIFDGGTRYLRRLQSHYTTLQPGAGYAPHVDAYDVAILVRTGTVETLGTQVGPGSVIFYAAGEPHGIRNVGETPATYLVFEFHGGDSVALASATLRARWRRWRRAMRRVKRRIPLLRKIALGRQGE